MMDRVNGWWTGYVGCHLQLTSLSCLIVLQDCKSKYLWASLMRRVLCCSHVYQYWHFEPGRRVVRVFHTYRICKKVNSLPLFSCIFSRISHTHTLALWTKWPQKRVLLRDNSKLKRNCNCTYETSPIKCNQPQSIFVSAFTEKHA